MSNNSTSLVIQHSISVKTEPHVSSQMDYWYLLKSRKLYMSVDITGSCKLYMLQVTKDSMNIITALENSIQLVNYNGINSFLLIIHARII